MGGLFVLEKFITPSLFKNKDIVDEWSYGTLAKRNQTMVTALTNHWVRGSSYDLFFRFPLLIIKNRLLSTQN
jgi:hypothetical protein